MSDAIGLIIFILILAGVYTVGHEIGANAISSIKQTEYEQAKSTRVLYLESVIDQYQKEPYEVHKIKGKYLRCSEIKMLGDADE